MITYIAFLRAINVGGQKLIKMEVLRRIFEGLGLKNVRTYIQSGNIIFASTSTNSTALTRKIEKKLKEVTGHEVTVILRKFSEIEVLVKQNPFRKIKPGSDGVLFVVFLSAMPTTKPKLPLVSKLENLEVLTIKGGAAFVVSRRKKNGLFGYPNNFVEKQLGVSGTTRNWSTVNKIVGFAANVEGKQAERKNR